MKSLTKNKMLFYSVAVSCILLNTSCEYDKIADAPYPESKVYLPIAVDGSISPGGIYTINEGASTAWVSPTPGQPLKYNVKRDDNHFIIPLGVYRSSMESRLSKDVTVELSLNQDTVSALINAGKLTDTEILPVNILQLPSSITIQKGQNNVFFDLIADLDFLRQGAPKKYAIGISISSSTGNINPKLNTGIIVINTQITIPVANFTAQLFGSTSDTYSFTNSSLYWDFFSGENAFSWDFGDGSPVSHEINPKHQYVAVGEYNVTLTVTGITGEPVILSKKVSVN